MYSIDCESETPLTNPEMTQIFIKNKFSLKVLVNNNLNFKINDCFKASANDVWGGGLSGSLITNLISL